MTEEKWLASRQARPILNFMRDNVPDRPLRLFACGCCLAYRPIRESPDLCHAVETIERYADGIITKEEAKITYVGSRDTPRSWIASIRSDHAFSAACSINKTLAHLENGWIARDIFGNPFRPVAFDTEWRTPTAVALAAGIYADKAFDRLPILADALEEAGCDSSEVLRHCRGDGPHVRGCWVVDAVLGKK